MRAIIQNGNREFYQPHVSLRYRQEWATLKVKQAVARGEKTKTKKKRRGKNLLQYFVEYEEINFRESSIQLVIDTNYFPNLLILIIRNRPNDLHLSHRIPLRKLSENQTFNTKINNISISLTLEPNVLLVRVQNEESSYLAGAVLKTQDQIHELLRLVWTDKIPLC